ncbi:MAG: DUF3524 domain-containing protein [Phycisphaerales bacterium]|nr:MAG: DUF3524 domain-containing protein [Phycisphaerales bacterium]
MRILALEPYYGGSHRAFLDGWSALSRHQWTLLTLPAYKWKWRMRHSAVTFADDLACRAVAANQWDVVLCSDMLNLAEFIALVPRALRGLPAVAYFHENQLTYPVRFESERDYQFAITNMTTALAAKAVWFNSAFHRDSFLEALSDFLKRMPNHQPLDVPERIREKSLVYPPGVEISAKRGPRKPGPLRILWAARWEHDKRPEDFFEALDILDAAGVDFRVSVIGEQFRDSPDVFESARRHLAGRIDRWGWLQERAEYEAALVEADVFVSTAAHEFFGISAVEAILAGAYPLLPKRLAYPEILALGTESNAEFFYDGSVAELGRKLGELAARLAGGGLWRGDPGRLSRLMGRFRWPSLVPILDDAIENARGSARRQSEAEPAG